MADHTELLKSMLQDIINDRQDNASVTMHDYFVSKTREVSGLAQADSQGRIEPQLDDLGNNDDQDDQDE